MVVKKINCALQQFSEEQGVCPATRPQNGLARSVERGGLGGEGGSRKFSAEMPFQLGGREIGYWIDCFRRQLWEY